MEERGEGTREEEGEWSRGQKGEREGNGRRKERGGEKGWGGGGVEDRRAGEGRKVEMEKRRIGMDRG